MTREVARREIESLDYYLQNHTDDYSEESHTAMMMAIKALEQEPTIKNDLEVDCISRKQAIDAFADLTPNIGYNKKAITEILQKVPPVASQEPKTGHWIHFASSDDCSECGWSTGKYESPSKFCPNCGIKMIDVPDTNIGNMSEIPTGSDPQESEKVN